MLMNKAMSKSVLRTINSNRFWANSINFFMMRIAAPLRVVFFLPSLPHEFGLPFDEKSDFLKKKPSKNTGNGISIRGLFFP